jgi:hypothetical protein
MTSFIAIRLLKLVNKNDPYISTLTIDDKNFEFDLVELKYMFAI